MCPALNKSCRYHLSGDIMKHLYVAFVLVALLGIGVMSYAVNNSINAQASYDLAFKPKMPKPKPPKVTKPRPSPTIVKPQRTVVVEDSNPDYVYTSDSSYDYLTERVRLLEQQVCVLANSVPSTPDIEQVKYQNNCY